MLRKSILAAALVIGLFTISYAQGNNVKKFVGVWKGILDMQGQSATVIFTFTEKEGKLSGSAESPEQGGGAVTLDNIVVVENKIQFEITAVRGGFDGVYKEDKKVLDGTLVFGDQGVPLALTKDEKAVPAAEKKFDSIWEGTLVVQDKSLKIIVKVFKNEDGTLGAFLDSPDQKASNIPAASVSLKEDTFSFELSALGASYSGKIDKTTMVSKGTFSQGGMELPLDLKKADTPAQK